MPSAANLVTSRIQQVNDAFRTSPSNDLGRIVMTREVARLEPETITLILSAVRTHDHFDEDGRTDKEATEAMESAIADCHAALKKNKIITRSMYAFAITGAATAAGAVFVPLLEIGGGIIGLGSFVLDRLAQNKLPEPKVAAIIYDARRRFGWK